MLGGSKDRSALHDLLGLRVIVSERHGSNEESAVWRVYQVLTSLQEWSVVPGRFKDYVTRAKPSGYQSLHLTLAHAPTGLHLEVQIRSRRMHTEAEFGSASHTRYKALLLPPSKQ